MSETKKRGFGGAIALILGGIVLLLITLFDIELDAEVLFELWPFVLIIIGVSLMPVARWLKTALLVIVLAAACITYEYKVDDGLFHKEGEVETVDTTEVSKFTEEMS